MTIELYNLLGMSGEDAVSRGFAALADPTRRAILERLAVGEAGVVELAVAASLTQPAITKQLKVLERAGLVARGRNAQWRPCRLEAQPLREASDWIGQYRAFWEARLDRLETYLRELESRDRPADRPRS